MSGSSSQAAKFKTRVGMIVALAAMATSGALASAAAPSAVVPLERTAQDVGVHLGIVKSPPRPSEGSSRGLTAAKVLVGIPEHEASKIAQVLMGHGTLLADQDGQEPPLKRVVYPRELMSEYQELVRLKHTDRLNVRQGRRLSQLRERINIISRSDEQSQDAAWRVQETNDRLDALLSDMEAKIALRSEPQRPNSG